MHCSQYSVNIRLLGGLVVIKVLNPHALIVAPASRLFSFCRLPFITLSRIVTVIVPTRKLGPKP